MTYERRPKSLEEVLVYWHQEGLRGDPEAFWLHFENNDWRVSGKTPMKSWKLAAKNWSRNEINYGRRQPVRVEPRSHQTFEARPAQALHPKVKEWLLAHDRDSGPRSYEEELRLEKEFDALVAECNKEVE